MNSSPALPPPSLLRESWHQWLMQSTARRPGTVWLQILWTAVFSTGIALAFTVLGFAANASSLGQWLDWRLWAHVFGPTWVVSMVIGYTIQLMFLLSRLTLGVRRIRAMAGWQRVVFFSAVPLSGVAIGWPVGMLLAYGNLQQLARLSPSGVLSMIVLSTGLSSLFFVYFSLRNREIRAEMRATDAQMRLLQGQMEPHFLFNTLANVISLIDTDAPRAKQTLESFTDYLRASLGSLRRTETTLGAELDLARRYLELMQARMGERLRFQVQADDALHGATLPPLLLQPLIENAVKHGLESQVDGGTVWIRASRSGSAGNELLELTVEDDGPGLAAAAARPRRQVAGGPDGHGIAIANLRERLMAQFGADGTLALTDRAGAARGTRATMQLPLRFEPAATPSAA